MVVETVIETVRVFQTNNNNIVMYVFLGFIYIFYIINVISLRFVFYWFFLLVTAPMNRVTWNHGAI